MARTREKTLFYNIRYRDSADVYHDAIGSGLASGPKYGRQRDVTEYEVTGYYGDDWCRSEGYVTVRAEDRDTADGIFRLLAREYSTVHLSVHHARDDEGRRACEYEEGRQIENLHPDDIPASFANAAVCEVPQAALTLSPERLAERARALEAMRKARLPKAPRVPRNSPNNGQIMPRLRARILERDNFRCKRCGNDATSTALEVDHIIPRAKGGTNDERNLQTLCWACNRGKSDSDPLPHELDGAA